MTTIRIPTPFANDGTRTPIDTTRTDGVVNMEQGYTDDYSRALGVDPSAKAVDRDRFNWLMYQFSVNIIDWQLHGNPQWIAQSVYEIGSMVRYTPGPTPEKIYRCISVPPVGTTPVNTTYWEEVFENSVLRGLIPMPYRGVVTVSTNFNTLDTNGTWVFDSPTVVTASPNSPADAGAGMLEVRLTGAAGGTLVQRYTGINGSVFIRGRVDATTWGAWVTDSFPVPVAQGGTGATTAAQARTNLGLGTAAVQNIGTSGAGVPLLNGTNTWGGFQTFGSSGGTRMQGFGGAANYGRLYGGTGAAFIEYDGAKWAVANPVNSTYTIIDGGGTTWTSGNFTPASKVNVAGDIMTGQLGIRAQFPLVSFYAPGQSIEQSFVGGWNNEMYIRSWDPNGTHQLGQSSELVLSYAAGLRYLRLNNLRFEINAAGNVYSVPESPNPGAGVTSFGYRTTGSYGGGYGMIDGGNTSGIWMASNGIEIGFGGLGSAVNSRFRLDSTGNLTVTGSYDIGSSEKIKDIEGDLEYGLNEINMIRTVRGKYKPEYNDDGRERLFFVAEQLAKIIPEAVNQEGPEFNGERVASVKIDQILPVLVKAIQQLSDEVKVLKRGAT